MPAENNTLLIFDFDNTITNSHMHNAFIESGYTDYNSGKEKAVTEQEIEKFLQENSGIKNERKLKDVLQSAFLSGVEVAIASFTQYPKAVEYVIKNHLGLKEQANSINIFSGFPYDNQPQGSVIVGKNLHIYRAIVNYKDKYHKLPRTVILVDDDSTNINQLNNFIEVISNRGEWLKKNKLSIEDIKNIKFIGVKVPKQNEGVAYLDTVQVLINNNLVQEPIYGNLKKEEPIYQNLQDIKGSSFQKKLLHRNNNRTENSTHTKENRTQSAEPSLTKKFLFRASAIVIGFLFGGLIGIAIALSVVAIDVVSNGKLIQGTEKVLYAGYNALSVVRRKMLNVEKTTFSEIKEARGLSKRDMEVSDHNHSTKSHVTSESKSKSKNRAEAELKKRASAEQQISQYR